MSTHRFARAALGPARAWSLAGWRCVTVSTTMHSVIQ
uniref:Uncharacterized protein n=1 Tax=Arundo donax TaxID=35708 RepID=A0A0A9CRR1_ARUDO